MSNPSKVKTYSDTFIYSISEEGTNHSISKAIIEFIGKADRINPVDSSFKTVADQVKLKQTTAVLFKIMMRKDVVLCVYNKEMPATMKVFAAKDILYDKKRRVFVDCTGLISMENGYWTCKDIGKLCSYLFAVMINLIYLIDSSKLTSNSSLIKTSTRCFVKMFTGILDNLRTINYEENRSKISYIAGVYYLYNMMGKDINYARATSIAAVKISPRDAQAYDLYYDIDKDLMNIDTLIRDMVHFFNLKGLDTSIYIDRWTFVYGKGTMYGMEYLPAFLDILAYAYVGAYLNNQKSIELICRQDMVSTATTLINIGSDMFNNVSNMDLESALENRREEWADDFGDGILDEVHKMAKISRYKKFEADRSKNKESKDNNDNSEYQTADTKDDTEMKKTYENTLMYNAKQEMVTEDDEFLIEAKMFKNKIGKFDLTPIYTDNNFKQVSSELKEAEEFLNSTGEPDKAKVNRQLANVSNIIRKVTSISTAATFGGAVGASIDAAADEIRAHAVAKAVGASQIKWIVLTVSLYIISRAVQALSGFSEDANTMKAINKDIEALEAFKKKTKNENAIKRCNSMIKKLEASKQKMINRGVKEDVMSDFDALVPVEEDTDLDSLLDEDF